MTFTSKYSITEIQRHFYKIGNLPNLELWYQEAIGTVYPAIMILYKNKRETVSTSTKKKEISIFSFVNIYTYLKSHQRAGKRYTFKGKRPVLLQ